MTKYAMKERQLELDESYDVVVVGGGPAGCASAISAAREGAKTLLIEATGVLGGMGTSGLVPAWACFAPTGGEEKAVYRGLAETIFKASKESTPFVDPKQMNWTPINSEALKRIYDDMVTEAGAHVLFHTVLAGVDTDSAGAVTAIIVANKSGMTAYRAPVFVDCTGDADLAVWAGADSKKGDEAGVMQPATHCCVISNVDLEAFKTGPFLHHSNPKSPGWDIAQDDEFPLIKDCAICVNVIGPNTVGCNAHHMWRIDNTDPTSTTTGLLTGRKQIDQFHRALKKYLPDAFGDSYLVTTGSLLGIRETRRITGDYVLTFDDYKARRSFPDEVLRNCQMVDIHPSEAEMPEAIKNRHEPTERYHYEKGESHGIPYRCLTPKGLKNVLVAGRSISTDRIVQGSIRTMPVCLAMGEAAGIAAAMAATKAADVHAVDTDDLRTRLKAYGAYLPNEEKV
jgi:hypothetical protein